MAGTLTLDFRHPETVELSYDLKDKDMLSIVTGGVGDFLTPVSKVTFSDGTLTVTVLGKTITFSNVNPDMNIQALRSLEPSTVYWGGKEMTVRDFYMNPKFANGDKTSFSNIFSASSGGTLFGKQNNSGGFNFFNNKKM
jgi:hypothetical protein